MAGAEQAAMAGFNVANVDLQPLQAALMETQTTLVSLTVAKNNLVQAQQRLIDQRTAIDGLIRHVVSDLRYALRDETPV